MKLSVFVATVAALLAGWAGAAGALPSTHPSDPVGDVLRRTGVGVSGSVGIEGGHVGITLPPIPICDVADCNPTGPVGVPLPVEKVVDMASQLSVDHTIRAGRSTVTVQGSAGGAAVGITLPPIPICNIADCNPTGPVGDPIIQTVQQIVGWLGIEVRPPAPRPSS